MDASLIGKCVASTGLVLDVVGAYYLFFSAFKRPRRLIEQAPLTKQLPLSSNGLLVTSITTGFMVDTQAITINRYNEYKDILYQRRAIVSFWFLASGFLLQALANFVGIYIGPIFAICISISDCVILTIAWWYFFRYIRDLPELEYNVARQVTMRLGESGGIGYESDPEFQAWAQTVDTERKKLRLR